nr:YmL10 [Polyrhizophydium stewartii]
MVRPPSEFLHASNVKPNPGSRKKAKRLGRGGKGKTAGRGRKGYKARQGKSGPVPGFAGGQTTIIKGIPKLGRQLKASRAKRGSYRPLALDTLQHWIDTKRIDPTKKITIRELLPCMGRVKDGVVLLATGAQFLKTKVDIEVTRATLGAIKAVEAAGGKVTTVYHNSEIIRATLFPEKYVEIPTIAVPNDPRNIARYTDPERRGYLAPLVKGADKSQLIQKLLDEVKTIAEKSRK